MNRLPSSDRTPLDLYRALLELHHECMAAGLAAAGYHALAAAMHCAEDARSLESLEAVIDLAVRRQAELDTEDPPHPLSGSQARLRGTTSVFESLVVTGRAIHGRLVAEAMRMKGEQRREEATRRVEAAKGAG